MILNGAAEGREWTVKEWKILIDRRVKVLGAAKWRMGIERKATLNWYKTKKMAKSELFYEGSWAGQLLLNARTKSLEVNLRTNRWNKNMQRMCMQCGMCVDETVVHMFLECEEYANEREVLFEVVSEAVGGNVWNEMRAGVDHGLCANSLSL